MNNQILDSNKNSTERENKKLSNKINCDNNKNKVKISGNNIPTENKKIL